MASIAELVLDAEDFPLGKTFGVAPAATIELDRVVPVGDTVMPFFWIHVPNEALDAVQKRLASLTELRSVSILQRFDDRGLFEAEWDPEYLGIMRAISNADLTVVSATGSVDGWTFELRSVDASQLRSFRDSCQENGIPVSLKRIHRLAPLPSVDSEYGVTPAQREALVLAYERGYYDSPAGTSLSALGEELGITGQSVGSRLRRGTASLLANTLVEEQ
jgi:hypothetical protein